MLWFLCLIDFDRVLPFTFILWSLRPLNLSHFAFWCDFDTRSSAVNASFTAILVSKVLGALETNPLQRIVWLVNRSQSVGDTWKEFSCKRSTRHWRMVKSCWMKCFIARKNQRELCQDQHEGLESWNHISECWLWSSGFDGCEAWQFHEH